MIHRLEWTLISFIIAAYLALAWQYAVRTPDWQAPDEPAHYNYVRQIVDEHKLPTLQMGDWNQAYQDALTAYNFAPALTECIDPPQGIPCPSGGLRTIEFEDHQPPLYYLLQAPVYALTGGDLTAMRMFSALLGAGVVLCAWAVMWTAFPRWPYLALTGAAFVAFIPQHLAILASVSNDALAELIAGLTLLAAAVYLGNSRTFAPEYDTSKPRHLYPVILGVLVGAALVTKTTIYFLVGIAVLAVLLRGRREGWRIVARHLAAVLIPALLIGGVWWARNVYVYGGLDFTGLSRHDEITIGQLRTGDYIDNVLGGSTGQYLENFAQTTFHSFWGQFGWMALPMPTNIYRVFLLFAVAVIAGVGLFVWRRGSPRRLRPPQQDIVLIFAAVIGLVVAEYVLYNRDFVQFQGRYLYPALIPLAFLVAVGLNGWTALFENLFPAMEWVPVTAMIGLALFAWYALDTYIVPNLPVW